MTDFTLPCDSNAFGDCHTCLNQGGRSQPANVICRALCGVFPEMGIIDYDASVMRCQRSTPENLNLYPAMCEQHGESLQPLWIATPVAYRKILLFTLYPDKFPVFILGPYAESLGVHSTQLVRFMFSPLGFWVLHPELTANLILINMAAIFNNPDNNLTLIPETFSYSFLADYVGEILEWLMMEDTNAKWNYLSYVVNTGLTLIFSCENPIVQPVNCGWRQDWRTRYNAYNPTNEMWGRLEEWMDILEARVFSIPLATANMISRERFEEMVQNIQMTLPQCS
jgi:hypothetical protein